MSSQYYVYVYLDPRKKGAYNYKSISFEYEPFYIGKGHGKRYLQHLKEKIEKNCNKGKIYKIQKIKKDTGQDPIIIKVKENITNSYASKIEISLIKQIGRMDLKKGPLTNLTNGGDGTCGLLVSEQSKLLNSLKQIGENGNRWGKINTEESKEKYRETRRCKKIKVRILQYNLDGSFIKTWDNLQTIRDSFESPTKIKRCCNANKDSIYYRAGKSDLLQWAYHRIYDFIWIWDDNTNVNQDIDTRTILKHPIIEVDIDGEIIKKYLYLEDLTSGGIYRTRFLNNIAKFSIIKYHNKIYKLLKND